VYDVAMHEVPSTPVRVHVAISIRGTPPHVPPPQTMSVHVRLCIPVSEQIMVVLVHVPYAPHEGAPHEMPSCDVRVHACVSVVEVGMQLPPVQ
jgi:hypothetical protein